MEARSQKHDSDNACTEQASVGIDYAVCRDPDRGRSLADAPLSTSTFSETRRRIEIDVRNLKLWKWECEDDASRRGVPGRSSAAAEDCQKPAKICGEEPSSAEGKGDQLEDSGGARGAVCETLTLAVIENCVDHGCVFLP